MVALGGLYILGTERHESRRIDNQLRGRAGRQGDPGTTRFYVSLEDELMRRFLELIRETKALRIKVELGVKRANEHMSVARSTMTDEEIEVALMMPAQRMNAAVETKNIMSVDVPVFKPELKSAKDGEIFSYGYAFTSGDLDEAVSSLA